MVGSVTNAVKQSAISYFILTWRAVFLGPATTHSYCISPCLVQSLRIYANSYHDCCPLSQLTKINVDQLLLQFDVDDNDDLVPDGSQLGFF